MVACDVPLGYVADATDCDDTEAASYPGNAEVCDTVDNDCDGSADNSAVDADTWYADDDADGYGDVATSVLSCDMPFGYVADLTDCDDTDAAVNPAATDDCDSVDNDCDGTVDNDMGIHTLDVQFTPYGGSYSGLSISGERIDASGVDVFTWGRGYGSAKRHDRDGWRNGYGRCGVQRVHR